MPNNSDFERNVIERWNPDGSVSLMLKPDDEHTYCLNRKKPSDHKWSSWEELYPEKPVDAVP